MAKLMVTAVLFLALLASANAVAIRTTVTTTIIEEEVNPWRQSERCREKVHPMQLKECIMYMSSGRPYDLALKMVVDHLEPMLQPCCMKLQNVPEECHCKVIKEMVMMIMEQQGQEQRLHSEEQMEEMMETAKHLPKRCKAKPHDCHF